MGSMYHTSLELGIRREAYFRKVGLVMGVAVLSAPPRERVGLVLSFTAPGSTAQGALLIPTL